jgi:hypothetical protein
MSAHLPQQPVCACVCVCVCAFARVSLYINVRSKYAAVHASSFMRTSDCCSEQHEKRPTYSDLLFDPLALQLTLN